VAAITAVVGRNPAGAWSGSGVALPVGAEGVVALALLRIRENFVGLADFFEPLASVLRLGDVGVVLAGEPPVGGLDGLIVGVLVDAEGPVVVLEFHAHDR